MQIIKQSGTCSIQAQSRVAGSRCRLLRLRMSNQVDFKFTKNKVKGVEIPVKQSSLLLPIYLQRCTKLGE